MSLHDVTPGDRAPGEFNVIIEIPMNADPIEHEVDAASGALFVSRFMATAMHYPCNEGYIPLDLHAAAKAAGPESDAAEDDRALLRALQGSRDRHWFKGVGCEGPEAEREAVRAGAAAWSSKRAG